MDRLGANHYHKAAARRLLRLPTPILVALVTVVALTTLVALGTQGLVRATNDDGKIAHWEFSEGNGTITSDSTGQGHDGTLNGPTWIAGGALLFDGQDDYVEVPDSPEFSPANNVAGLTVTAWIRPDRFDFDGTDITCGCAIHFLSKGNAGQHEWVFRLHNDTAEDADGNLYRPKRVTFYVFNLDGGLGVGS